MPYSELDLSKLVPEIRRPFMSGEYSRDALWDRRRGIRFRRALPWIPDNLRKAIAADNLPPQVYFRDSLPGFIVNRVKQRLGENGLDISVKTRGDAGPSVQRKAENIEDWLRGVLDDLDPQGLIDSQIREHQAGDGLGVLKLEFQRDFIPPSRADESDGDYDDLVSDARKTWGLPVAASSIDPRSLYWIENKDRIQHVVEVLNLPLVEIQNKWSAEGFRIALMDEKTGKVERDPLIMGALPPSPTPAEYGRMCRVVLITDDDYCYHCMYPNAAPAGFANADPFGDSAGAPGRSVPLILLAKYPNLLKRSPYFFAAGRRTSEQNPAFRYEPIALESIESAEYTNSWVTMQTVLSTLEALKPVGIRPRDPSNVGENAAPVHMQGMWQPGFLDLKNREIVPIPSPETKQFELLLADIKSREQQFNLSIMGALNSGTIGKSAPAWTVMQFNEEQTGMISEALNHRSTMYKDALRSICYLAETKYGQSGPIYVRGRGKNRKEAFEGDTETLIGLKSEDFSIPWRLEVRIEAMSQSQRAANTEYFRDLHAEGSMSDRTYWEAIGIKDISQEQARKDREFLMAPLRKAGLAMGQQMGADAMFKIHGPRILPILQAVGLPPPSQELAGAMQQPGMPPGAPPQQPGASAGQSQEVPSSPIMPGQGMSITQPEPQQPRQLVAPQANAGGGM